MKAYSDFNTAVANFEATINDLLTSADQAEITVKELQGQKVSALMLGQVAESVILSKQINDTHEIVVHNRESAELMASGKWKAFIGMVTKADAEKDTIIAEALSLFEVKAVKVSKAKAAYLKELAEIGAIHNEAVFVANEAAEVTNVINEFKGNPSKQTYRYPRLNWESTTTELRLFVPNERRHTKDGLIAISEHDQEAIFEAGKVL